MIKPLTTVSVVLMLTGCASDGSATAPPICGPVIRDPISGVETHYKTEISHAAGPRCTEPKQSVPAEIRAEGRSICDMPPGHERERALEAFKHKHRLKVALCTGPETSI